MKPSRQSQKYGAMDQRHLNRYISNNPFAFLSEIQNLVNRDLSLSTIQRMEKQVCCRLHKITKKKRLTKDMKKKWLNWARSYADIADEFWSSIMYTDEAHFDIGYSDPKKIYRKKDGTIHTGLVAKRLKNNNRIEVIDWPGWSPI